jgi:hypothetical protein
MRQEYENTGLPYLVMVIGHMTVSYTTGVSIEQFDISIVMT